MINWLTIWIEWQICAWKYAMLPYCIMIMDYKITWTSLLITCFTNNIDLWIYLVSILIFHIGHLLCNKNAGLWQLFRLIRFVLGDSFRLNFFWLRAPTTFVIAVTCTSRTPGLPESRSHCILIYYVLSLLLSRG